MPISEEDILNDGLYMAMEFGENWLMPIQDRLSKKYPHLPKETLDRYNSTYRAIMSSSNEFILKKLEEAYQSKRELSPHEFLSQLDKKNLIANLVSFLHQNYGWINQENISSLYSQAMYYSFK